MVGKIIAAGKIHKFPGRKCCMFEEVFVFSIKCLLWKYKSLNSRFYHKILACWDWLSSAIIIGVFDYQTYHLYFQRLYFNLRELEGILSRQICNNKVFELSCMPCFQPKERVGILGVFLSKTFPFTVLKLWGARCNRGKAGYFYNYSVYVMYHSCN